MLSVIALDVSGRVYALPAPAEMTLEQSLTTPCDALRLRCPADALYPSFARVSLAEGDSVLFTGVIDVQTTSADSDGWLLELRARSDAAALLDNEAAPATYMNPLFSDIFTRHAAPYGIAGFAGEDRRLEGPFQVEKGMSEWQVLERFARRAYGVLPRLDGNRLQLVPAGIGEPVIFSNTLAGARRYLGARVCIRRHQPLSEVLTRADDLSPYALSFPDYGSLEQRISRRRVCVYAHMSIPQRKDAAAALLGGARAGWREVELNTAEDSCPLGARLRLIDSRMGRFDTLLLVEESRGVSAAGDVTTLTCWPEEDYTYAINAGAL